MHDANSELTSEPWSLLSKAESWCKLGLQDEAVIAADEAIEAQLSEVFSRLGVRKPLDPMKTMMLLSKQGVTISFKRLTRLKELREKATRDGGGTLSQPEVEEAISIAEDIITKVEEPHESAGFKPGSRSSQRAASAKSKGSFEFRSGHRGIFTSSQFEPTDLAALSYHPSKDARQVDTEFVTKLLLARAILSYKKKRIPRFIGIAFIAVSVVACILFTTVGGAGLMLMFTGRTLFSLLPFAFDLVFLFVAYLFFKIALYIRHETY